MTWTTPIKTQFKPSLMFRVFKENLKLAARSFSSGLKSNQMLRETLGMSFAEF